jgi:hypothetical protein
LSGIKQLIEKGFYFEKWGGGLGCFAYLPICQFVYLGFTFGEFAWGSLVKSGSKLLIWGGAPKIFIFFSTAFQPRQWIKSKMLSSYV